MENKDPRDSRPKDINTNAAAEQHQTSHLRAQLVVPPRNANGAQATPSQMQDPPPVKRRKRSLW